MSLTQELEDKCENVGSKINLSKEFFDSNSNSNITTNNSDSQRPFLRVGRPGKLILQQHYTAFTKSNLGTIPSKVEKTLIKTDVNVPITITVSKNSQKMNYTSSDEQTYKDPRSYSTSYSSKGYGIGFLSQVPRFQKDMISGYYPGPGQYSSEKTISIENDMNKSYLGSSFLLKKTNKSMRLPDNNNIQFFTSHELLKRLNNNNTANNSRYSIDSVLDSISDNKVGHSEDNKGNYYFESKVIKSKGLFKTNDNPGPGRYFLDTKYKIKNENKISPNFIMPIKKKDNPLKTFGLNDNDEKQIGFGLKENKKNGKIATFWNGAPTFGNSYDFGKPIKNANKFSTIENNVVTLPNNDIYKKLQRFRDKKKRSLTEEKYDFNYNKYINQKLVKKDLSIFRRKDLFRLASPRWDQGLYHDNQSHFQNPGPAYYNPKIQSQKRSFNLNNKSFIYTNSVPYREISKYEPYANINQ